MSSSLMGSEITKKTSNNSPHARQNTFYLFILGFKDMEG